MLNQKSRFDVAARQRQTSELWQMESEARAFEKGERCARSMATSSDLNSTIWGSETIITAGGKFNKDCVRLGACRTGVYKALQRL